MSTSIEKLFENTDRIMLAMNETASSGIQVIQMQTDSLNEDWVREMSGELGWCAQLLNSFGGAFNYGLILLVFALIIAWIAFFGNWMGAFKSVGGGGFGTMFTILLFISVGFVLATSFSTVREALLSLGLCG